jgi:hypothetical protein
MPDYTTGSGNTSELLPDNSEWDFVVENATEKESANHNEMIELELRILKKGGAEGPLIYDNLVFVEKAYWKIDQFRQATGETLVPGEQVTFNADDCLDRKGRLVVLVDVYQGRSKNKVDHYVLPGEVISSSPEPTDIDF